MAFSTPEPTTEAPARTPFMTPVSQVQAADLPMAVAVPMMTLPVPVVTASAPFL